MSNAGFDRFMGLVMTTQTTFHSSDDSQTSFSQALAQFATAADLSKILRTYAKLDSKAADGKWVETVDPTSRVIKLLSYVKQFHNLIS
ncbi:hypothetical protein [Moorena sp. SIO3H5]|uniref:hypothetical protein n=1 Tax=Moorena sp. SIO3H5 TaxID=2607834 RepID=UPI0013BCD358|nr:hypothetical protein [Moorena sp. SIO3H5]NEO70338.1 hypothetical protein [Moorena sp. SIO3H5]